MSGSSVYWRCFHCGEAFTKAQEKHARDHFGLRCDDTPVCLMRAPGEHNLLRALRDAQEELDNRRAEDTEIIRALHSMSADNVTALRREEELGYNRGVSDMTDHVAALEVCVIEIESALCQSTFANKDIVASTRDAIAALRAEYVASGV